MWIYKIYWNKYKKSLSIRKIYKFDDEKVEIDDDL